MSSSVPTLRGMGTGAGWKRRIKTPEQLFDEFEAYIKFAEENLWFAAEGKFDPETKKVTPTKIKHGSWTIVSFCHFLGIGTKSWHNWRNKREDLKPAIEVIEERIRDHRNRGAEAGVFNPGFVSWQNERQERLAAEKAELPATPPTVAAQYIANTWHPEMTKEQEDALLAAGVDIPLYPQALIDQGIPFHMPATPEAEDDAE